MHNKRANFYGILVLALIIVTILGTVTIGPSPTGFAVEGNKCFDGTDSGQCSSIKPKYCDNGALKSNCGRCGCSEDEVCQSDGNCLLKCSDGTPFGQCSENKPLLCFKGSLEQNCFECGCFPGQVCLNNGLCSGNIEVGAGEIKKEDAMDIIKKKASEEKIIEECADGSSFGQCSLEKPRYCQDGALVDNCEMCGCNAGEICSNSVCLKKSDAGFWWDIFCKVLYYNEYEDCIADAIRYENRNK